MNLESCSNPEEIMERCPLYESDLCREEYFEGDLCSLSCIYMEKTASKLLEKGKERLELAEGYEF